MEISQTAYLWLILYSFVIGVGLGVVYDVIRIARIALKPGLAGAGKENVKNAEHTQEPKKKIGLFDFVFTFLTDMAFSVVSAAVIIILIYHKNSGIFRWFVLFFAAVGFCVYFNTVGKIIILCSEKIIIFIRRILMFLYKVTLKPFLFIFKLIFSVIYDKINIILLKKNSERLKRKLIEKASNGFV